MFWMPSICSSTSLTKSLMISIKFCSTIEKRATAQDWSTIIYQQGIEHNLQPSIQTFIDILPRNTAATVRYLPCLTEEVNNLMIVEEQFHLKFLPWVTGSHHILGIEHLLSQFRNRESPEWNRQALKQGQIVHTRHDARTEINTRRCKHAIIENFKLYLYCWLPLAVRGAKPGIKKCSLMGAQV